MSVVEESIVIEAAVEKVFAVQDEPERVVEYMPSVVRVKSIRRTPERIGDLVRVTYSVRGLRFATEVTTLSWKKNQLMAFKLEGGVHR